MRIICFYSGWDGINVGHFIYTCITRNINNDIELTFCNMRQKGPGKSTKPILIYCNFPNVGTKGLEPCKISFGLCHINLVIHKILIRIV